MLTLPALNHLLQQNPEIRHAMQAHRHRQVCLQWPLERVTAQIDEHGYWQAGTGDAEVTLHFLPTALLKPMQGLRPGVGDVTIHGDQALGMALLPLLAELRYWPNADIGRLFGDAAAGEALRQQQRLQQHAAALRDSLAGQIRDYTWEADAPVINRRQFAPWSAAVDTLRDDVARLEARLRRLETE